MISQLSTCCKQTNKQKKIKSKTKKKKTEEDAQEKAKIRGSSLIRASQERPAPIRRGI